VATAKPTKNAGTITDVHPQRLNPRIPPRVSGGWTGAELSRTSLGRTEAVAEAYLGLLLVCLRASPATKPSEECPIRL
jgi:hypothetical protein